MLKLNQDYSDYTDETDENYPEGKAINASSSESVDGTPLLAEFMNDVNAAHIAMYEKAYGNRNGISGVADTQKVSQFADAVAKLVIDKIKAHADLRGLADGVHGATSEAFSGQIACRDEFGNLKVGTAIDDSDAINLGAVKQSFKDADLKEASHRDVDTVVTAGSENVPTSGAVNNALTDYYDKEEIDEFNTYSTEEVVIGKYMGKLLYRRVRKSLVNSTAKTWFNMLVDDFNVEQIVNCHGSDKTLKIHFPAILVQQLNGYIQGYMDNTALKTTTDIIIEYTKTTD